MDKKKLQLELKSLREKATALETTNGDGVWPTEAVKSYQDIISQAEGIRSQIDAIDKMDAIKAWSEASSGSAVRAGFAREALPSEGVIPGVIDDGTGDLVALKGIGEQKLAALKSGAYKDALVEYVRAVGTGRAMKNDAIKVLQEGQDEAGGFWVTPDYRSELIKKIATMVQIRSNAFTFTTGSDIASFPSVKYTTDQKYTSGVRFSWTAEAPANNISEGTNPVSGRINIPIHTATAAIYLTRAMLEDTQFDLMGYISQLITEAYALGEEDAFINGDGAGKPEGFINHAMAAVAHGTGDGMLVTTGDANKVLWGTASAGAAVTKGLLGVEAALPPQYEERAAWYANKGTYSVVRSLVDDSKRPLWQTTDAPGLTNWVRGLPQTLLGYPVKKSQFMPDVTADAKVMAFGDMGGYYIGDRVGLSIEVFREVAALRDMVVVYARKRLGGQFVHPWKLKLLKVAA